MAEFWRVRCKSCGKDFLVYSRPALEVRCRACGEVLLRPKAAKPEILCEILEVLE